MSKRGWCRARITISIHICNLALYLHTRHKGGRVDARIGQRPQVYVLQRLAGRSVGYLLTCTGPPSRVAGTRAWLTCRWGDTVDIRQESTLKLPSWLPMPVQFWFPFSFGLCVLLEPSEGYVCIHIHMYIYQLYFIMCIIS